MKKYRRKNLAGVCGFRNDIIMPRAALSAEKLARLPRWMPARININFTTSTDTFSFARPNSRVAGRPRIRDWSDLWSPILECASRLTLEISCSYSSIR